jgi:hypothetical protein
MDALIGAADQRITFFDFGIDAAVSACPVRVLAEETDAPWNEDFHCEIPC